MITDIQSIGDIAQLLVSGVIDWKEKSRNDRLAT